VVVELQRMGHTPRVIGPLNGNKEDAAG
jgi:hypothetical protein